MQFVEPIIIQGINKDVSPGALDYSGRRILNPVRDVLNARYLTSEGEHAGKVENIPGTEEVPEFAIFKEATLNGDFIGSTDPWFGQGAGLDWTYSAGTARVSSADSGTITTKKMYQENPGTSFVTAGEIATIATKGKIETGFTSMKIFGHIFNFNAGLIYTFLIGTIDVQGTDAEFTVQQEMPVGGLLWGFSLELEGVGVSSVASLDYFKVQVASTSSLPDGICEVIGSYENVEKNLLLYFLWNSNGYHGVFKYNASTNTILQVLADNPDTPVLKFDRYKLITGIGMIGDLLFWTDNNERQCCVNITRTYATLNENVISLAKIGPKNYPTFTNRTSDANVTFNKLSSDSFQFAFMYVYLDNELSVLSPYSKLCSGDVLWNAVSTLRAKILVSHTIDGDVFSIIKEVRLLYRKNNEPNWYVWKRVTAFGGTIAEYFFNNEQGTLVDTTHTSKLFDLIPNKSRALTVFRGRVFLNINEDGFSFTPPAVSVIHSSDYTLDGTDISGLGGANVQIRGGFIKKNGAQIAGIFFRDKFGKLTGIVSKAPINGPAWSISDTYNINANIVSLDSLNKVFKKMVIEIAGQGPPNCEYFVALSGDQNYTQYMQMPSHILWYVGTAEGDGVNPYTGLDTIKVKGTQRIYLKNIPTSTTYKYIHFLLPKEIPWVPDKDCFVRFAISGITKVERVVDVLDGDIIVTGNFGITNWATQPTATGAPLIEIFKVNNVIAPFLYQSPIGPFTTDSVGTLDNTFVGNVEGDTFALYLKEFSFREYSLQSFQGVGGVKKQWVTPPIFIESASPMAKSVVTQTDETVHAQTFINIASGVKQPQGISPDLTKIASSKGWPLVEAKPLIVNRAATIRFSDPYIEGTEINGLSSFPVANVYDKIGQDRSPITKLVAVGNILLAVHERRVTSMYIGEGIIRAGETGFIAKVDDVVGDDRQLVGDMGSYNPESVQSVDGQAFGYDIYTGVVWRYTVEGVIAISNFGMMNYFKTRSEKYFPYRDELRFVSAIDSYHKEYLLTMPHLFLHKETAPVQSFSSSSFQYDFVLDPEDYVSGERYRLKILPYQQGGSSDHKIIVNVAFNNNGLERIGPANIGHTVDSTTETDADPIYLEFLYQGEDYIAIIFSSVFQPISVKISTEYQELAGETWAYNYRAKVWAQRFSFIPEYMGQVGTRVIGFKDGRVYKMFTSGTHNNFFGTQYTRRIEAECNPVPGKVKTWSATQISVDELMADDDGTEKVIEVSNDEGQESYTRAKEFEKKEGVYNGPILKDVNTNAALIPAGRIALRDGKDMRSKTMNVVIHNDSTGAARMQKLNIVGEFSEFSI